MIYRCNTTGCNGLASVAKDGTYEWVCPGCDSTQQIVYFQPEAQDVSAHWRRVAAKLDAQTAYEAELSGGLDDPAPNFTAELRERSIESYHYGSVLLCEELGVVFGYSRIKCNTNVKVHAWAPQSVITGGDPKSGYGYEKLTRHGFGQPSFTTPNRKQSLI